VLPETTFLVACLRRCFQPNSPLPSAAELNWDGLLDLAHRHTVAPLLYAMLHDAEVAPPDFLNRLRGSVQAIARFNLSLSAELVRLLSIFGRHGIDVRPLKGPALSAALYGNLGFRTFADLDLLVRRKDVRPAKELVEAEGYRLISTLHWPVDSACLRARESELSFLHSDNRIVIDLHWRILPRYFPISFDVNQVWGTPRLVSLGGVEVPTLSPEHLLLFLCAHGTKHLWLRLGWICDLGRLIQLESGLDWADVLAEATRTHTRRMVSLGLLLAADLLGVEPPLEARPFVDDRIARKLAGIIRQRVLIDAPFPPTGWDAGLLSVRALSRTSHRMSFVLGSLSPSEAEYRSLPLPPVLYWLYFPFRPLRLTVKYARRLTGL